MTVKRGSKRALEKQIEHVDATIADVDQKKSEADAALHTHYREALVKLKEVRALADSQIERLQESGEETWDDLKEDVDEAIERVRFNLDSLVSRFSDDAAVKPAEQHKDTQKKPKTKKSKI